MKSVFLSPSWFSVSQLCSILFNFVLLIYFTDTGLPLSTDDGVQLSDIHGHGGVTKTDVADLEGSVMNDYIDVHGEMMSLLDDAGGDNTNDNNNNGRANGAGRGSIAGSVQGDAG